MKQIYYFVHCIGGRFFSFGSILPDLPACSSRKATFGKGRRSTQYQNSVQKPSGIVLPCWIITVSCGVLLFTGCGNKESQLMIIGGVSVLREDLNYRYQVYKKCYPEVKTDTISVLTELIRDNLDLAVLASAYHFSPTDSMLEKKSQLINQNTRAPEILECIKSVYKENKGAYFRNVVSTTLVNPQLHTLFSTDTVIQKNIHDSIKQINNKLIIEKKDITQLPGYNKYSIQKPAKDDTIMGKYKMTLAPDPLIEEILVLLKPGETDTQIYSDEYSYRIVRLISENDSSYLCDGIILTKENYDNWFVNYVQKNIKIEVYDANLKNELKEKLSDVWWTSLIQ